MGKSLRTKNRFGYLSEKLLFEKIKFTVEGKKRRTQVQSGSRDLITT